MNKFKKSDVKFFLKDSFKGLSKKYMIDCIFNEQIQKKWYPRVGDIIVGCTGNIFVISGKHTLHEDLGGNTFFFGGGLCNRNGGCFMDDTYCSILNKDGMKYVHSDNGIEKVNDPYYSKFEDFRYVPYPHEL